MSLIGRIQYLTVHPNSLLIRNENLYDTPKPHWNRESLANLERNVHHNKMSDQSSRKCKRAINYLLFNSQKNYNYSKLNWRDLQFKIAFITLTLSSEQKHSDNYIKKFMLNNFLIEAKRLWNIENYVWRAEKQANNNIHFHILVDRFIPWQEIRAVWNRIQNNHGYIAQYRKNMKAYHRFGFKLNNELLSKWNVTNQLKAYKTGIKTNWSNPNSTDIHQIKLINNVAAYVTKYMTKDKKANHLRIKASSISYEKKHLKNMHSLSFATMRYLRKKAETGRLWSCSVELTQLKGATCEVDSRISSELAIIAKDYRAKVYDDSYVKIVSVPIQAAIDNKCITITQMLSEYMCDHFIFKDKLFTKT
jgi:hypothetical protein